MQTAVEFRTSLLWTDTSTFFPPFSCSFLCACLTTLPNLSTYPLPYSIRPSNTHTVTLALTRSSMPVRTPVQGVLLLLHCLGISASLARLVYRIRTRRFWWDDFWAFVAVLSDLVFLMAFSINVVASNYRASEARKFLILVAVTSTLWGSRMSIAIAIVRLVPPGHGQRMAKGAAVLFSLIWCGLLTEKLYACQNQSSTSRIFQCLLPIRAGILEICMDIVGDLWLICSPAYLLWNVKLNHRRQILIFSVFASDLFVTVASIIHGVHILQQKQAAILISANVELGLSLIICNLLVLATWLYSRIYPADQEQDVTTSVNYPTTSSASRRLRHPDAPIYGFEGSVLVLTQISSPSISIISTISDDRLYLVPEPHTQSLNTLYPTISIPRKVLSTKYRSTRSCPPLLSSTPLILSKMPSQDDIRWENNVPLEARISKRSSTTSPSLNWELGSSGCSSI